MKRHCPICALLGVLLIACALVLPAAASRVDPNAAPTESPTPTDTPLAETADTPPQPREIPETPEGGWDVYVVPIDGVIADPQLYILRRALKEAIKNKVDVVVLKMNTPGGDSGTMLAMMDALTKYAGTTITYVDKEAFSAGSFISIATDDIWFSPFGVMGASEAIMANGQDLPPALKRKLESALDVKVRSITQDYRYRADVQRAMMDPDYVLEIDGHVLKPEGKLLSLTAQEAIKQYGAPPEPLLAEGVAENITDVLDQKYGAENYQVKHFEVSWVERFAKVISTIGVIIMGLGIVMLGMEMKSPGFGIPGIIGILLITVFFFGKYGAGLTGAEGILLFLIGIIFIAVELFLLPGTIIAGITGIVLVISSLVWAMADIWPEGSKGFELKPELFIAPIGQVILGLGIAFALGLVLFKFLPDSPLKRAIVLGAQVDGHAVERGGGRSLDGAPASTLPQPGDRGLAATDLHPGGQVEINGKRFQALVLIGSIDSGESVEVIETRDFSLVVRAV
ncbi:NfeD family protein [Cerasicoccus frondis]|uniref:NfeD family protein n=1 Tax=Cerasicoccus frondis TaxID=490090 RepID=UPI002852C0E1|nr:hypothetical protein [Cerasicoccus frondis]